MIKLANEMLRIYLNKKKHGLEKQEEIRKNRELLPETHLKWTASKTDAIELGYAFHESGVFNNGHADIKEIMNFFESPIPAPFAKIIVNRLPWGKTIGKHTLLITSLLQVENRIKNGFQ